MNSKLPKSILKQVSLPQTHFVYEYMYFLRVTRRVDMQKNIYFLIFGALLWSKMCSLSSFSPITSEPFCLRVYLFGGLPEAQYQEKFNFWYLDRYFGLKCALFHPLDLRIEQQTSQKYFKHFSLPQNNFVLGYIHFEGSQKHRY